MKGAPVFVKIEEYRDVLDIVNLLKEKISDANKVIEKINQLKAKEDAEIESWQNSLDEVETKINMIDKTLLDVNNV